MNRERLISIHLVVPVLPLKKKHCCNDHAICKTRTAGKLRCSRWLNQKFSRAAEGIRSRNSGILSRTHSFMKRYDGSIGDFEFQRNGGEPAHCKSRAKLIPLRDGVGKRRRPGTRDLRYSVGGLPGRILTFYGEL